MSDDASFLREEPAEAYEEPQREVRCLICTCKRESPEGDAACAVDVFGQHVFAEMRTFTVKL